MKPTYTFREHTVKTGSFVYNVHIPSKGPMTEDVRLASYKRIYDYIENLDVFEENQEEGLTWFKVAASNGNKWAAEIIAKINGKVPPE